MADAKRVGPVAAAAALMALAGGVPGTTLDLVLSDTSKKPKRVQFDQRVHTHSREKARRRRQMERAR